MHLGCCCISTSKPGAKKTCLARWRVIIVHHYDVVVIQLYICLAVTLHFTIMVAFVSTKKLHPSHHASGVSALTPAHPDLGDGTHGVPFLFLSPLEDRLHDCAGLLLGLVVHTRRLLQDAGDGHVDVRLQQHGRGNLGTGVAE